MQRSKYILVGIGLFFLISNCQTQTPVRYGLAQCVEYAQQHAIAIQNAQLQKQLTQADEHQTQASRLPTANYSLYDNYQHGLTTDPTTNVLSDASLFGGGMGLEVRYTLFNWFARKYQINAARLKTQTEQENINKIKNDIALDVVNYYLQVLLRAEQVKLNETQLSLTQQQIDNSQTLVNAGARTPLDLLQFQTSLQNDSANLYQAIGLKNQALLNLKTYLTIPIETPLELDNSSIQHFKNLRIEDYDPQTLYQTALPLQPNFKARQLQLSAARYTTQALQAAKYPTVTLVGNLNTRFANNIYDYNIGSYYGPNGNQVSVGGSTYDVYSNQSYYYNPQKVSLPNQLNRFFGQSIQLIISVPLLNSYTAQTQWQKSKINERQLQIQKQQDELQLKKTIFTSFEEAQVAQQKYRATQKSAAYAEQALHIANQQYQAGRLSNLELITIQTNLFKSRIECTNNEYDFIFKLALLHYYARQQLE